MVYLTSERSEIPVAVPEILDNVRMFMNMRQKLTFIDGFSGGLQDSCCHGARSWALCDLTEDSAIGPGPKKAEQVAANC